MASKYTMQGDSCNEGRKLAEQARKLWQKLQPNLWLKSNSPASLTTSERIKPRKAHNNASGSTQKVG